VLPAPAAQPPPCRSRNSHMNQIVHGLSTYFFVAAVVRACLSTHTLGIIASERFPGTCS
jgi:hypothetical protein